MTDQRDVQQLIQSLTPSAVNNGNPNTVYNQPMPQGGYIPPTYDPGTNTWRINTAPPAPTVDWRQMALGQAQPVSNWNPTNMANNGSGVPVVPVPAPVPVTGTGPLPEPPVPAPVTGGNLPAEPTPAVGGQPRRNGGGHLSADPFQDDGTGCVVVDSFLQEYDRADEVQVGDEMSVIDPVSFGTGTGKVSFSETKVVPCVRITTESGITLDCSRTAPIADENGEQILAPDLLHKLIPVCDNGIFYLDRVTTIEDLGELPVQHITVENNFFLAGKEKGRYIFHHNVKMIPGSGINLFALMDGLNAQFGWSTNSGGFGAESMSSAPNTRGAMQANGTWDIAHGGTASNPATAWGDAQQSANSNYVPTGQGLVDAFGGSLLPSGNTANAPNPWAQPTAVDSWNPDMSKLTPSPVDFSGYGPQLNAPPVLQAEEKPAGGGFWNWLDNNIAGNLYDENSGTWNKGNIGLGVLDAVTGLPFSSSVQRMGEANLFGDGGRGSDMARTQLQQQFDRSNSTQRSEMVQKLAQQYKTTPEAILQVIGR